MLNTPDQLRKQAAFFRQFPHPKAQRAAQLAEAAALANEQRRASGLKDAPPLAPCDAPIQF